jgi:DNA-binding transcriptional LysR family regulator
MQHTACQQQSIGPAVIERVETMLVDLGSIEQISELKAGRIDLGFGRMRSNDTSVARTVLREERLVLAIPPAWPLAAEKGPVHLEDLKHPKLIVFPKEPRPSFADHVLGLLHERSIRLGEVHEVRELHAALGLVAAEVGMCIVPAASRLRSDLVYRLIANEEVTSPIILSHRLNDDSWYIVEIKQLIAEMYAQNPPWLDFQTNAFPSNPATGVGTPSKRDGAEPKQDLQVGGL